MTTLFSFWFANRSGVGSIPNRSLASRFASSESDRVDDLDPHLAAARDAVFVEQVLDLRHQRRELGVGLRREVAADQQRLVEAGEDLLGGSRQRVRAVLREVDARAPHRLEPDVERDRIREHEADGDRAARSPADALEQQHVDADSDGEDAGVVREVTQVEDAACNALEPRAGAAERVGDRARERGADERDDLIIGRGGHAHADRQVRRGQQQRREIAADHRAPVEVAHVGDRQRQAERQRERDARSARARR